MKNIIFILLIIFAIASCKKNEDPKPTNKSVSYKITIINNRPQSYKLAYRDPSLSSYIYQTVPANNTTIVDQTFPDGVPTGNDQKINVYTSTNSLEGTIYWGNGSAYTIAWN